MNPRQVGTGGHATTAPPYPRNFSYEGSRVKNKSDTMPILKGMLGHSQQWEPFPHFHTDQTQKTNLVAPAIVLSQLSTLAPALPSS